MPVTSWRPATGRLSRTVSGLDAAVDRFVLTVAGSPYTIQYAGVTDQDGLDALLGRAATDQLRTTVRCQTLDDCHCTANMPAQTVRHAAAQGDCRNGQGDDLGTGHRRAHLHAPAMGQARLCR